MKIAEMHIIRVIITFLAAIASLHIAMAVGKSVTMNSKLIASY